MNDLIEVVICDDDARMCQDLEKRVKEQLSKSRVRCFPSGDQLLASEAESFR